MAILTIQATKSLPYVNFDDTTHHLEIRGESYPENVAEFYMPIFTWLDAYLGCLDHNTVTLDVKIAYFNSSSSKVLMDMFDKLEMAAAAGNTVIINWYYHEADDMLLEYGEEFKEDIQSATFNLISFKHDDLSPIAP